MNDYGLGIRDDFHSNLIFQDGPYMLWNQFFCKRFFKIFSLSIHFPLLLYKWLSFFWNVFLSFLILLGESLCSEFLNKIKFAPFWFWWDLNLNRLLVCDSQSVEKGHNVEIIISYAMGQGVLDTRKEPEKDTTLFAFPLLVLTVPLHLSLTRLFCLFVSFFKQTSFYWTCSKLR